MIKIPLTVNGAEQLKAELQRLKSVERPSVSLRSPRRVPMAIFRKMPNMTPPRSARVSSKAVSPRSRAKLANAQVIDPAQLDADGRCVFGATIDLEDLESGDNVTYQIVGDDEADIKRGKISVGSPIARALIGKYAGDVAEVQAPGGVREYEVLDVKYI